MTEEEVLERIHSVLQAVSVIPYQYLEHDHENPLATISIWTCEILKEIDIVETDSYKLLVIDAAFGAKIQ